MNGPFYVTSNCSQLTRKVLFNRFWQVSKLPTASDSLYTMQDTSNGQYESYDGNCFSSDGKKNQLMQVKLMQICRSDIYHIKCSKPQCTLAILWFQKPCLLKFKLWYLNVFLLRDHNFHLHYVNLPHLPPPSLMEDAVDWERDMLGDGPTIH